MDADAEEKVIQRMGIEQVADTDVCCKVQVVHQVTGAVAFPIHLALFNVAHGFDIRQTFGKAETPVGRPADIQVRLDSQNILVGRL